MSSDTAPIGVSLRPEYDASALGRLGDYSKVAEKKGFDSVWIAESWGLDATVLLAHVGSVTERIRIGTSIINVYSRTPSLLAMTSVTLNDLYGGRFILGLGASTAALIEGWHGLKFDKPVTRMRETIEIVRKLTQGETLKYEGKTAAVHGYRLRFEPQKGAPPIYLAALGPEGLKLTGQASDGWLPYLLPRRGLTETATLIHAEARAAGRPEGAVCIAPLVPTAVAENGEEARDAIRQHLAFYLGAMGPHYRGFVSRYGFETEVETVRQAWANKEHKAARAAITDLMIDEIGVAGTPAECREKFAKWRAAGADLPIAFFPGTCSNAMVELAMETLTGK